MPTAHVHRLRHLLVHDDIYLNSLFRFSLQESIEPPFRKVGRWPAEIELRAEPPIEDEDVLLSGIDQLRDGVEVICREHPCQSLDRCMHDILQRPTVAVDEPEHNA